MSIFRRKPRLEPRPCEVLLIEDSDNLRASLGITHERLGELIMALNSRLQETNRMDIAIADTSKQCVHPNELAMMCYAASTIMHEAAMSVIIKRIKP